MPSLMTRLLHAWAVLTGNHTRALVLSEMIIMADFTAFDAALDRVVAKSQSDAAALAAAQTEAANLQGEIDARTAKLDALAPMPAPTEAEAAATEEPAA